MAYDSFSTSVLPVKVAAPVIRHNPRPPEVAERASTILQDNRSAAPQKKNATLADVRPIVPQSLPQLEQDSKDSVEKRKLSFISAQLKAKQVFASAEFVQQATAPVSPQDVGLPPAAPPSAPVDIVA